MASSIISDNCKIGLKHAIFSIVKAVFPTKCISCGKLYHDQISRIEKTCDDVGLNADDDIGFERDTAPYLCSACRMGFVPVRSPICDKCGMMFESRVGEDHLCQTCMEGGPIFKKARAVGVYCDTLMALIHAFKYNGKIQLAGLLGNMIFNTFLTHWEENDVDLVMPVPLHPKRLRERGFNQAFLLIKRWPENFKRIGIEGFPLKISHDALSRVKRTSSQTGLNRKQRSENIKNAFQVKDAVKINGRRILLVDDVYTTGATINECAGVLTKAGAERVDVLTLARA